MNTNNKYRCSCSTCAKRRIAKANKPWPTPTKEKKKS